MMRQTDRPHNRSRRCSDCPRNTIGICFGAKLGLGLQDVVVETSPPRKTTFIDVRDCGLGTTSHL
jgi:hypothetical protein